MLLYQVLVLASYDMEGGFRSLLFLHSGVAEHSRSSLVVDQEVVDTFYFSLLVEIKM